MTDSRAYKTLTLEERYTSTPESRQFQQELEQSLHPRSPDMLLDMAGELGLGPESTILDVGCGTGWAACRLAERTAAQIVAIDLVPSLLATTSKAVKAAGLERRIYEQWLADAHWFPYILLGKLLPVVYLLRK